MAYIFQFKSQARSPVTWYVAALDGLFLQAPVRETLTHSSKPRLLSKTSRSSLVAILEARTCPCEDGAILLIDLGCVSHQ